LNLALEQTDATTVPLGSAVLAPRVGRTGGGTDATPLASWGPAITACSGRATVGAGALVAATDRPGANIGGAYLMTYWCTPEVTT
jgi:hypothetical protein